MIDLRNITITNGSIPAGNVTWIFLFSRAYNECLFEWQNMGSLLLAVGIVLCILIIVSTTTINCAKDMQTEFIGKGNKKRRETKDRRISWVEKVDRSKVKLPNPQAKELRLIGLFLSAHKYFEIDRRYALTKSEADEPTFYKHFPLPRLRKQHPEVVSACDQGFLQCVEEIHGKAKRSGSLAKIHKTFGNNSIQYASYYPFKDSLELFQYRVTASYYMCWYTDLREEPLALIDTNDCFQDLELTEEASGTKIVDFRSKITHPGDKYSIYTCAYLWFCPDPCYGKSTGGNVKSFQEALTDSLNPCGSLLNKECVWKIEQNKEFNNLIRNKFNYTCDCENEQPGYVWSPVFSICVDRDECYEGRDNCPDGKICRNTVHSFDCTCRRGYHLNKTADKCERNELLSPAAATALAKNKKIRDQMKEKQKGVLYILKLLVEIAGGSSKLLYSKLLLFTSLTLCILSIL